MTHTAWTTFQPLDVWCSDCHAAPGIRCVWTDGEGRSFSREPHASRVLSARDATAASRRRASQRQPSSRP